MIQFSKLRINGFKSFVERSEVEIAPGLNGVVGPNGCGKSNLVEALRWVMGESSAKRMRGDGMEDVIFSGTDKRAARNIAEVALLLDNRKRTAPAAYNGADEIEVVRRIERDKGSNYKINGKNVRARDVQMLFADTVTGANSPAMISQGRVAQIINAKPHDRRMILEESAGISGLYVRRHEAELRLKAADRNLERIEDVLGSMEERLNGLKRQARQAARYRNLGAQIRQLEVLISWLEWQALEERRRTTQEKFGAAESIVADKLASVTQLTKTQNTQMEDLPPLRQKEAESAAALQVQKMALQRIEDESARLDGLLREAQTQLEQAKTDAAHEGQTLAESTANFETLEQEHKILLEKESGEAGKLAERQKARDDLSAKVAQLDERYTALMQGEAEARARKQSLEQQIAQNTARIETLKERRANAASELEKLNAGNENSGKIKGFEKEIGSLEAQITALGTDIEKLVKKQDSVRENADKAREALKQEETAFSELAAEIKMLESFLSGDKNGEFIPVLDIVTPESGFEKALSRALGDALMASLEEDAPSKWLRRKISAVDMPALPDGAKSLLPHVKAPEELHMALSQIGFVKDEQTGHKLMEALKPGQALVSAEGMYWRWDGYFVKAEASDRNARHLEQKNKLKELEGKKSKMDKAVAKARTELEKAVGAQTELEQQLKAQQDGRRQKETELTQQRASLSALRESQARFDSELKRLSDVTQTADEDIKTLEDVIRWDQERLAAHEKDSQNQNAENTEKVREGLSEARASHQEAIRSFDRIQQEQNSRKARLHAIADERISLQNRAIRARERLKQLEERKTALEEKLAELKAQPKDFKNDKEKILSLISNLEEQRNKAAENLAVCEQEVAETSRALKEAESDLSTAREARAHAQATLAGIQEQHDALKTNIAEKFDVQPHELPQHASIDVEADHGAMDNLKQKRDGLVRDRDSIGPVNLRADEEALELEKEVGGLLHERNDLMAAIAELRGAIQKINAEARERLSSAFDHVNGHFQSLFTRLFGGGTAYLKLTDSDDPLEAGLEIFAQPPGKALQSLSLLSGGEQALTSIALIFGMFLTNPSPICVLDEIDAPLDDANVNRVCDLLEEISERGETRFLIITHHRLTMARMDRLYGVTMAERGVSQLVSVDLQQSFEFLEAA